MKKKTNTFLVHNIAILLLLLWAFAQALIMVLCAEENIVTALIMLAATNAAVMVGFLDRSSACTALSGTITCVWMAYKLYAYYASGMLLGLTDYLLTPMPLLGCGIAVLYCHSVHGVNSENSLLRRQVEELVLVDELTGLYNQRAFYRDLQVMVHYCSRNGLPVSVLMVQPRYLDELSGILSAHSYNEFLQKFAEGVRHSIRVEDRVYAMDDKGMLGVVLTCDEAGAVIVRNRIASALQKEDAFAGILDREIRLDLRFACKRYDNSFGNDMMTFKKAVESELVYDV